MTDEAFPGVRLHVVAPARPVDNSPLRMDSGPPSTRRVKTLDDLKDESGVRFASNNAQWASLPAPQKTHSSESTGTVGGSEQRHKKEKKDKHKSKDRDRERERDREKQSQHDADYEERQRKRNEPKPRPSRQMSASAITALTSDYVKMRPDGKSYNSNRASLAPPSLPSRTSRPSTTGVVGRHSNADLHMHSSQV